MQVKNKRVLKNGAIGGYVRQSDGSYKWRIIGHVKKTGGFLPEPEQIKLLLSVKDELKNFIKFKISKFGRRSERKQRFEDYLNQLNQLGNNRNSNRAKAEVIKTVINGIVAYYNGKNNNETNTGYRSKNLNKQIFDFGKKARVEKFFAIFYKVCDNGDDKVEGINYLTDDNTDVLAIYDAWRRRVKPVNTILNAYPQSQESESTEYNEQALNVLKNLEKKKNPLKVIAPYLYKIQNRKTISGKTNVVRKSEQLLKLILNLKQRRNNEIQPVPATTKLMLVRRIFKDKEKITPTDLREELRQLDIYKVRDKMNNLYQDIYEKVVTLDTQLREREPTKVNTNSKNDKIKKILENKKITNQLSKEEMEMLKNINFNVVKKVRTRKQKELYIKNGRKILLDKYALYSNYDFDGETYYELANQQNMNKISYNRRRGNSILAYNNLASKIQSYVGSRANKEDERRLYRLVRGQQTLGNGQNIPELQRNAGMASEVVNDNNETIDNRLRQFGRIKTGLETERQNLERGRAIEGGRTLEIVRKELTKINKLITELENLKQKFIRNGRLTLPNGFFLTRNQPGHLETLSNNYQYNNRARLTNNQKAIYENLQRNKTAILEEESNERRTQKMNSLIAGLRKRIEKKITSIQTKLRNGERTNFKGRITKALIRKEFIELKILLKFLREELNQTNAYINKERNLTRNIRPLNLNVNLTQQIRELAVENRIRNGMSLKNFRETFLIETFKSLLCNFSDDAFRNRQQGYQNVVNKLKENNDSYEKIMRKAAQYASVKKTQSNNTKKEKELNYEVFFIYNQIRAQWILRDLFKQIRKDAEKVNKELLNSSIEDRLSRGARTPVVPAPPGVPVPGVPVPVVAPNLRQNAERQNAQRLRQRRNRVNAEQNAEQLVRGLIQQAEEALRRAEVAGRNEWLEGAREAAENARTASVQANVVARSVDSNIVTGLAQNAARIAQNAARIVRGLEPEQREQPRFGRQRRQGRRNQAARNAANQAERQAAEELLNNAIQKVNQYLNVCGEGNECNTLRNNINDLQQLLLNLTQQNIQDSINNAQTILTQSRELIQNVLRNTAALILTRATSLVEQNQTDENMQLINQIVNLNEQIKRNVIKNNANNDNYVNIRNNINQMGELMNQITDTRGVARKFFNGVKGIFTGGKKTTKKKPTKKKPTKKKTTKKKTTKKKTTKKKTTKKKTTKKKTTKKKVIKKKKTKKKIIKKKTTKKKTTKRKYK